MKKPFVSLAVTMLFFSAFSAHAVMVDLDADQTKAAVEFSSRHKGNSVEALNKKYSVGQSGPYAEHAILRTKWYKLARMAILKSRSSQTLPAEEQSNIRDDPFLQIDVTVYGHSLTFARTYSVFIRQGEKIIQPERIHADHSQASNQAGLGGFPSYRAAVRAYFKYDELDPAGKAELVLNKEGKEKVFELDLSKFK